MVYGASAPFYYAEPPFTSPGAFKALLLFAVLNQGWFMGAFFLLAGYFVPGSYDRKGSGTFLKGRFVRLGIPLVLFIFVLGPLSSLGFYLMPPELTGITAPLSWQAYPDLMGMGPLWFAAMLLIFCTGYAVWRMLIGKRAPAAKRDTVAPSYVGIGVFVLGLAAASYGMRMVVPLGQEVLGFPTLAYLPQYLSFFIVGILAARRNWFRTVPMSVGVTGLVAALAASVVLFPLAVSGSFFSLALGPALDNAMGNGHWQSAVYALWDSIFAVGLCLGLIPLFRRVANRRSPLGSFLAQQSFGVYVVHVPVIVFLAYAMRGIALPPMQKVVLASMVMLPASFAVAYVVRLGSVVLTGSKKIRRGRAGSDQPNVEASAVAVGEGRVRAGETEIAIEGLAKAYGDVRAVNGLTFEIKKGELFGLLGPNGAGKTTTISILCGLLAPSAGTATIGGLDVSTEMAKIKERIGVCPQEAAVYKFLTGRENIELFGQLQGLDRQAARARCDDLLAQTDFADAAKRKAKGYSGGMVRQLNLLMAMVSDPDIVFLDEPTVGMDARARRRTWAYIASLKDQGKTVILTTHYIEEAQALSDRVGIIDYGELIALGTPEALMVQYEAKDLEAVFLTITGRRIAEGS
jgi:ABC-type multidrug transport system ATPase subunit/peptidoglycan/LPS O-acetylase OafA/YrhL